MAFSITGPVWSRESGCPCHWFSLVICQHPVTRKYLAVEETGDRGWWLPGGFVEPGDDVESTAHKETVEEAGIEIELVGVLRVNAAISERRGRLQVVYFARPKDIDQAPKNVPDKESKSAKWLTVDELEEMDRKGLLRGPELLLWGKYVDSGGPIYPLTIVSTKEGKLPCIPDSPYEKASK